MNQVPNKKTKDASVISVTKRNTRKKRKAPIFETIQDEDDLTFKDLNVREMAESAELIEDSVTVLTEMIEDDDLEVLEARESFESKWRKRNLQAFLEEESVLIESDDEVHVVL